MARSIFASATVLAMAPLAATASAQEIERRLTPADIDRLSVVAAGAGTSGIAAIETRILSGDPTKSGPYTISIRVPPNTRIAAHSHRDARSAVVAAGLWHFGYGGEADPALSSPLPVGSWYAEPANVAHFAWTGPEGATVHITGFGPSDTHYVSARPLEPKR